MRWMLLLLLVPMVAAHGDAHGEELYIEAHDDDGWYFTVEGYEGRNPTLILEPGDEYHVVFVNRGTIAHDLHIGEFATPLLSGGDRHEMNITVPAGGFDAYWCDPHRDLGMEGRIVASQEDLESPGPAIGLLIALVGLLGIRARR